MIFVALNEAADKGELLLVEGGLCRFHRRKDGTVVIREILVLPNARRLGKGRRMIDTIRARHPQARLLAKCPAADAMGRVGAGNVFWQHMGFTLTAATEKLNTWERRP